MCHNFILQDGQIVTLGKDLEEIDIDNNCRCCKGVNRYSRMLPLQPFDCCGETKNLSVVNYGGCDCLPDPDCGKFERRLNLNVTNKQLHYKVYT